MHESLGPARVSDTKPPQCIMAKWLRCLLSREAGAPPFNLRGRRTRQRNRQDRVFVIPPPGSALPEASLFDDPETHVVITGIVQSRDKLVARREKDQVAKQSPFLKIAPEIKLMIYQQIIDSETTHKLDISAIPPLARTSQLIRREFLTEYFFKGSFQLPIISLIFDKNRHGLVEDRSATGPLLLKASSEMACEQNTSPMLIRDITFHIYPFRTDDLGELTPKTDLPKSSWATWRLRWVADKQEFHDTYAVHPEHCTVNNSRLHEWYAAMMQRRWTPQLARNIAQSHADEPDFRGWSIEQLQFIAWAYKTEEFQRLSSVSPPHAWGWGQFSGENDASAAEAIPTEDQAYLQDYTETAGELDTGYESDDEEDQEVEEDEEDGNGVHESEGDHGHLERELRESGNRDQLSRDYDLVSEETKRLIMQHLMHPGWHLCDDQHDAHPLRALFDEMIKQDMDAAGSVDSWTFADGLMPFEPR